MCVHTNNDEVRHGVNEGTNRSGVVEDNIQILLDGGPDALGYKTDSSVAVVDGDEYRINTVNRPSKDLRRSPRLSRENAT